MKLAEGVGVEPTSPCGEPRLSKPVQYRSASLPIGSGAWNRTTVANFKGSRPTTERRRNEWCAREGSNLQTPDSETGACANSATRALVKRAGVEPAVFTQWVAVLQTAALAAVRPLRKWCARLESNQHRQAPRACASAIGLRAHGGPPRIRTETRLLLRQLHLPIVLAARRIQLWWRGGGSNSQEVFHSAVFGTAGLAICDRPLRRAVLTARANSANLVRTIAREKVGTRDGNCITGCAA